VFLRRFDEGDEGYKDEEERILASYNTPAFKYFCKYAFNIAHLKVTVFAPEDTNLQEPKIIDDVGITDAVYQKDPQSGLYREENWFTFNQNVVLKVNNQIVYKNAGDKILLHYSIRFKDEEIVDLLEARGFKVVKKYTDDQKKNAKILIRKMTEKEKQAYNSKHNISKPEDPVTESDPKKPAKRKSGVFSASKKAA
jgi:hypothetical protein